MKTILTLVAAALCATSAGAETVVVIEGEAHPVVRIAHDDLNLRSDRGRERLNSRVAAAVRELCGTGNRDILAIEMSKRRCYSLSMEDAGSQIERLLKSQSMGLASVSSTLTLAGR